MLTPAQSERYRRNTLIPEIGEAGQERLAESSVCVVGLGGLGSSAAYYLAAAGVGTLGLIDSDCVELSNLQRQILHGTERVGSSKAESAATALRDLNPEIRLIEVRARVTNTNARELFEPYQMVVEATDSFAAKFLVNDVCLGLRRPFVTAGILALSGQAMFVVPGRTPCLRCMLPDPPDGVPTTSEIGVLGAVPGILGSIEALEAIRYLAGIWKPRADGHGNLHSIDGMAMRLRTISVPRRADCRCYPLWSDE